MSGEPLDEDSARTLVDASTEVLREWVARPERPVDVDVARQLLARAIPHHAGPGLRRRMRAVVSNLAPPLLFAGEWGAVRDALARTIGAEPDTPELRGRLGMLLANLMRATHARGPAEAADLPELWLELAEADPDRALGWEALAAVAAAVGGALVRAGQGDHAPRAVAPLELVPEPLADRVAPARARWLRDSALAEVHAGRLRAALARTDELESLALAHPRPAVVRAAVEALGAALRAPGLAYVGGMGAAAERARRFRELAGGHLADRAVAAAFARAAFALAPVAQSDGKEPGALALVDELRAVALAWPHDGPILGGLAEAVSVTARSARLLALAPEAVHREAGLTLGLLAALAPGDPRVTRAAALAELPGPLPKMAAPPSRPGHPAVERMRELSRNIESTPGGVAAAGELAALLGDEGPLPDRFVLPGGEEDGLCELVDELGRLLEAAPPVPDLVPRIEALTRQLVAGAPDRVAEAALDLRDRAGFPPMIRIPTGLAETVETTCAPGA